MKIADIITAGRVEIDVAATSKKSVLEALARLVIGGTKGITAAQAFDGLITRERLGNTGLGLGIAIPHGRISHLDRMQGAFLRTARPIDFDAVDGQAVDLFFALLVPETTTAEHNEMLAELAGLFSDEALVHRLRQLQSTDAVHALLVGA